jgi:hypothetical protein
MCRCKSPRSVARQGEDRRHDYVSICDDKQCYQPETTPFEIQPTLCRPGVIQPNEPELFAGFDPSVFSRLKRRPVGQKVSIFGET